MTEKSIFREAWNPELKTKNMGKKTSKHGEEKSLSKSFFATLISTLGIFNKKKKKPVIYTLS